MREWRKKLFNASFRGVPFFIHEHEGGGGREVVKHEYPKRDLADHEDMRAATRPYNLTAFVIGNDYMTAKGALIEALNEPGPGLLVHPFHGDLYVVALPYTYKESFSEGGICRFNLKFEETAEKTAVAEPRPDYSMLAIESADFSITSANASFASMFDLSGPDFISDGAFDDFLSFVNTAQDAITSIPEIYEKSALGQMVAAFEKANSEISQLISSSASMATWVQNKITGLSSLGVYKNTYASFNALMKIFGFGDSLPHIPKGTYYRSLQLQNRNATLSLVKQTALSEAVKTAVKMGLESRGQSDFIQNILVSAIDEELTDAGDTGDDDRYLSLQDLRTRLSRAMAEKAGALPYITTWKVPPTTTPALILAYDKYEDLDREEEIVNRNPHIHHPGFLPEGRTLELLNV